MNTDLNTQHPTITLLTEARAGSSAAWGELTARYDGMLRAVTARCGLPEAQAADVIQTTWMRLLERGVDLRDPEHLGGWLKTVAQREAWRYSAKWRREDALPDDGAAHLPTDDEQTDPEAVAIRQDQHRQLWAAIATLPARQRDLMTLLTLDDTVSYESVAAQLSMPIGSIGPTRARAMTRLRLCLGATRQPTAAKPSRALPSAAVAVAS